MMCFETNINSMNEEDQMLVCLARVYEKTFNIMNKWLELKYKNNRYLPRHLKQQQQGRMDAKDCDNLVRVFLYKTIELVKTNISSYFAKAFNVPP